MKAADLEEGYEVSAGPAGAIPPEEFFLKHFGCTQCGQKNEKAVPLCDSCTQKLQEMLEGEES